MPRPKARDSTPASVAPAPTAGIVPAGSVDPRNKFQDIAEFNVSAQRITESLFFRLYTVYSWGSELIAALAGLGIGYPLLSQAAGPKVIETGNPIVKEIVTFFGSGWGLMAGFVLAIVWLLLKTAVTRDDGIKRAVQMRTCVREIRGEMVKVDRIIRNEAAPLPELGKIYTTLLDIQQRHLRERGWPFEDGFAARINEEVEKQSEEWYQLWRKRNPAPAGPAAVNLQAE